MIRDARALDFWRESHAYWRAKVPFGKAMLMADAETVEFAKRFCTLDERVEVEDTLRRIEEGNASDE